MADRPNVMIIPGITLEQARKAVMGERMNELKPCPFCGESGEEIQDYTYHIPGNIYIGIFYCRNCGGAMIDTDKNHCWLDRAELWNKRFCADGERKDGDGE